MISRMSMGVLRMVAAWFDFQGTADIAVLIAETPKARIRRYNLPRKDKNGREKKGMGPPVHLYLVDTTSFTPND